MASVVWPTLATVAALVAGAISHGSGRSAGTAGLRWVAGHHSSLLLFSVLAGAAGSSAAVLGPGWEVYRSRCLHSSARAAGHADR